MSWQFWKREKVKPGEEKLAGPKDIPELLGRYMAVEMKQDPNRVWSLKGVVRQVGNKEFYGRVFDKAQAAKAGVQVKNWASLDDHPELILLEGYFNKETNTARAEKYAPKPPA